MRTGEVYKHIRNTEVAMLVVKMRFVAEKGGYKIRCHWLNVVNAKNVFDMGAVDSVFIKSDEMKNWRNYE